MVVSEADVKNIMGGMQQTSGVRINNKHKLRHRFDIVKKLGQGTYGKVQLAINKETGQDVAIKTIKKARIETEKDLIRIRREIQIMSSVTHPHIIHIYEVFENRDKMVLVMEYAAGGELYDYLSERKVLSEEEARRIFRQVASACYYCHKHKICHRDLKLENILLDEFGNAKIADFGLSNVFDESRVLSTYCGSPLYASPEIVRGTPYTGPEVDCWSLGVLLYTLVYGAMPFDGSNFKKLVKQITAGDFYEPPKLSTASELIHALLTPAPDQRASMLDVCGHWWVNQDEEASCLQLAEELANQTPVRLDLLLSLAPQEPDKEHVMALADDPAILPEPGDAAKKDFNNSDSLSLNSAMELDPSSSPGPPPNSPRPSETESAAAEKAAKRALDDVEEAAASARKSEKAKTEKAAKKKKKKPQTASDPAVSSLVGPDVPMGDIAEETEVQEGGAAVPEGDLPAPEPTEEPSSVMTSTEPTKPFTEPANGEVVLKDDLEAAEEAEVESVLPPVAEDIAAASVPAPLKADVSPADSGKSAAEPSREASSSVPTPDQPSAVAEVMPSAPVPTKVAERTGESVSPASDKHGDDINAQKPSELPAEPVSALSTEPSEQVAVEEKPKRKSYMKYSPKDAPKSGDSDLEQVPHSPPKDTIVASKEPTIDESGKERRKKEDLKHSNAHFGEKEALHKNEEPRDKARTPSPTKVKTSKLPRPSPPKHDCLGVKTPKKESEPTGAVKSTPTPAAKPKTVHDTTPETEVVKTPSNKALVEDSTIGNVSQESVTPTPAPARVTPEGSTDQIKTKEATPKPVPKTKAKSPKPESKPKDRVIQPKPSLHIDDVRRRPGSREPSDSMSSVLGPAAEEEARPAAPSAQERLTGDDRPSDPPKEKQKTQPPKRAPSKEYIIPITLTDDEPAGKDDVRKPVSDIKPVTPPSERVAPAKPAVPKPTVEARRPAKSVSTTSSLHSLPERDSSSGEEDEDREVTSSGDTLTSQRPQQASLTRSSRREFIIPIALEGGGVMTPPASLASADTERKQGASLFRTHQLGGPRRIGSLLGERSVTGEDPWPAPWGGLKRVSSMRDFEDRPLAGLNNSWSAGSRRLSRPRLSGSGERADSQSSGGEEEDEEDQFELFTADSLFGSLMDRVRNMSRRRAGDDTAGKRGFLLSEPLRISSTGLGGPRPRLPSLFGAHGQVRSLFDQPMTFKHGSLFDQPPFARHSSLGSQSVGESSDSGSQQEDNSDAEQTRTRTRVKTVKRTTTPQGTRTVTTITTVKPKARSQSQADM